MSLICDGDLCIRLGGHDLNLLFQKTHFSNVMFGTFFTNFNTTLIFTSSLNFGSIDEIF